MHPPFRGAARQPEAALLTASSKPTSPAATPGPSASHPLPVPAGMPGAHGTAWEAAGNERALCLGAVKGACLPGAPPVLSREGPWPSEGTLHHWGLARAPLQGMWGAPDGTGPGLQWARQCPSPAPGTQPGHHGSPPDPQSQGTPKALHRVSGHRRRDANPSREAAPSFNEATMSLSTCQNLCLEARMWGVQNPPGANPGGSLWSQLCPGASSTNPRSPAPSPSCEQGDASPRSLSAARVSREGARCHPHAQVSPPHCPFPTTQRKPTHPLRC